MKVDIVTANGHKLGEVDVYRSSWLDGIPKETQIELDVAVLRGRLQLELKVQRGDHSCSCHTKNQGPCEVCRALGCSLWLPTHADETLF